MLTKEYPDLAALLATLDLHDEYDQVRTLMVSLAHVREQGFFTKEELLRVCKWKEPRERMRRHWQANSEEQVQALTRAALATSSEIERIHHLTQLRGVGVPVASAMLTLIEPERYGVIDVRVWRVLHTYGEVEHTPQGINIGQGHWHEYLPIIRRYAIDFGVTVRGVERALYAYHQSKATLG